MQPQLKDNLAGGPMCTSAKKSTVHITKHDNSELYAFKAQRCLILDSDWWECLVIVPAARQMHLF